jgi:general stress protein YciG
MENIKQQAGRKGGLATFTRHGRVHMQAIGKRGASVTWTRYTLKPINQGQYAMVSRETNKIISIW